MATRKKITKRLLSRLKESQSYDLCLTAPEIQEIKLYLRHHRACGQITVENDEEPIFALPLPHLPSFIKSQLEVQKIDTDDADQSAQISAILHFVTSSLVGNPSEEPSSAAIFSWRCPRRSYCIFAFLHFPMDSRVYSAAELLELRGSQMSHALLNKVKLNPELAEIATGAGLNTQSRRLRKPKDDPLSSTDSEDQVVYQGKKHNRPPTSNGARSLVSSSNVSGDSEWKSRARPEPEQVPIEPRPAPTGLAAQQSEGFQRFFKAVVSPTHVRVTAGGRIVPNTRTSSSPTAKWDKERVAPDSETDDIGKHGSRENSAPIGNQQQPIWSPGMMHPLMSSMYPGFPPMFSPMGGPMPGMPFYPMPNGMPFPYGMPPPQGSQFSGPPPSAAETKKAQKSEEDDSSAPSTAGDQESRKPKPAPIKISPPDQFDQTRPYYYNGNLIYPGVSPGQLPPHMQMPPSPFFPPGLAGHPAFAQPRATSLQQPPMPSMLSPNGLPPNFAPPMSAGGPITPQIPQQPQKPMAATPTASAPAPPITSIKPSEITKRQLNSLRNQLKYYEDQLQYNKHQIDERATQEQVSGFRTLIDQFEYNYKKQLGFETTYYPNGGDKRPTSAKRESASEAAPYQTPSRSPSAEDSEGYRVGGARSANQGTSQLSHAQSVDQLRSRAVKERLQKAGINSSQSNDTSAALGALEAHLKQSQSSDPSRKTSLTTAAALAPPFEPRSTPKAPAGAIDGSVASESQWKSPEVLPPSQPGVWNNIRGPKDVFSFQQRAESAAGHAPKISLNGHAPYLVGKLPQGVNPYQASPTDYVYSRGLTEEETRARHVYWGQVSSKGLGLPKFDGKDFYPASPSKLIEKADGPPKLKIRHLPTGRPEVDYGLELPKLDSDPFRISRDTDSLRSEKSVKVSRAVPIVNPDTLKRDDETKSSKAASGTSSQTSASSEDNRKVSDGDSLPLTSPTRPPAVSVGERKPPASLSRRALERSSNKSGNDLWQSMLKKGPPSGVAVPSTLSSTTAKGFLPQYAGGAAASLTPAMANTNGASMRPVVSSNKPSEPETIRPVETSGENCPPSEMTHKQADIIADLHQRMLIDAERRGVIAPGWRP